MLNFNCIQYILADKATRDASREHWKKCYIEAVKAGDEYNANFSAIQLANRIIAEDFIKEKLTEE